MTSFAAIQMCSSLDEAENFSTCERLLDEAAEKGARFVVLPENFLRFGIKVKPSISEQYAFINRMITLAKSKGLNIFPGTYPIQAEVLNKIFASDPEISSRQSAPLSDIEKPFATSLSVTSEGKCIAYYNKLHLFDVDVSENSKRRPYRESDEYRAGDSLGLSDSGIGKIGMAICYDLRFPEYFQVLARRGAKVVIVPSAFTEATGEPHWEVLLRARAIENQIYIVAANQGARSPNFHECGLATWGDSMIVSPWGEVLAKQDVGEGVVIADLDFSTIEDIREKMPVSIHRSSRLTTLT